MLGGPFDATRCNVIDPAGSPANECDVADIFVLERFVAGSSTSVGDLCEAYRGP